MDTGTSCPRDVTCHLHGTLQQTHCSNHNPESCIQRAVIIALALTAHCQPRLQGPATGDIHTRNKTRMKLHLELQQLPFQSQRD